MTKEIAGNTFEKLMFANVFFTIHSAAGVKSLATNYGIMTKIGKK